MTDRVHWHSLQESTMLMNARTGSAVARAIELADTRATRRKGLLGRDGLAESSALVLTPCFAIHTIGMRFPIDVLFLDREGTILKIIEEMRPGRLAASLRSRGVIEMASGQLSHLDVKLGDRLYFR